jgi:hypothetical protein
MIPRIWVRWLHVAAFVVILFGLAMVTVPAVIREFFSLLFYSAPDAIGTAFGADANAYIIFAHGVLGAVMAGWGVAMLIALRGPFARGQKEGWLLIAIPLMVWYLIDTAFSILAGFWQNAVLNTALAVLFAIPLLATRRHFRTGETG